MAAIKGYNSYAWWPQIATPSGDDLPGAGYNLIYPKADGLYYKINSAGTESLLGVGGAGTWLAVSLTGTGGAGFLEALAQASSPAAPAAAGVRLFAQASGYLSWREKVSTDTFVRTLAGILSADRTYTLPDVPGEVLIGSVTSSATAGGTVTLTSASARTQIRTGTLNETDKMPAANTLVLGWEFLIRNSSSGIVTVQDNSAGAIATLAASQEVLLVCTNVGSAAGAWSIQAVTGSGARVNATSPTIVTPTIAKLANLTSNGVIRTSGGDGTLAVDTSIDSGWAAAGETWAYVSADAPTFTFKIAGIDLTGKYSAGMRLRISQATGGTKYFIITAIAFSTDTTITVYGGTDYTLTNETISSPVYSIAKAPYGFPLSPAKWTVELIDTQYYGQSSPVTNTVYNLGSLSISAPIGAWRAYYGARLYGVKSGGPISIHMSLSTAANSISDATISALIYEETSAAVGMASREGQYVFTVKTMLYLVIFTDLGASDIYVHSTSEVPTVVRLVCAYL